MVKSYFVTGKRQMYCLKFYFTDQSYESYLPIYEGQFSPMKTSKYLKKVDTLIHSMQLLAKEYFCSFTIHKSKDRCLYSLNFALNVPRPLFVYFLFIYKQTLHFLQPIKVKKCPSSLQCLDSNPQPSEYESTPLTTRPGL